MRWIKANMVSTSSGDRPSEGSSRISNFGSDMSPRPMASICCSPPESEPASCSQRSAKRGKIVANSLEVVGAPCPSAPKASELEVLANRQVGKDAPAFGHLDQAKLDHARGVGSMDVLAIEPHAASSLRCNARQDVVERRFAGAVAAEQGHDLAPSDVEAHASENLDDAVSSAEVANLKHGRPRAATAPRRRDPDRPRSRPGRPRSPPASRWR